MQTLTEQLLAFPTRIHPFDLYHYLSESSKTDILALSTEDNVLRLGGREFVITTSVPVVTEGGKNII